MHRIANRSEPRRALDSRHRLLSRIRLANKSFESAASVSEESEENSEGDSPGFNEVTSEIVYLKDKIKRVNLKSELKKVNLENELKRVFRE